MNIEKTLPVLAIAFFSIGAAGVSGCHVETHAKVGGDQPAPPAPPQPPAAPSPPAPATAEAPPPPPPAPEPPKRVIALKGGVRMKSATQIDMPGDIEFQKASSAIVMNDKTKKVLVQLAAILKTNPEVTKLSIEGNTDNEGETKGFDNAKLSLQRAQAVIEWLGKNGVDPKRLTPVGNGSKNPLVANDTPDHMAENRRVEFHVREFASSPVASEGGPKVSGSAPPPVANAAVAPASPRQPVANAAVAPAAPKQATDKDKAK